MKYFTFNKKNGKYECTAEFGKTSKEMSEEYSEVTKARIRQYAFEKKLPYFGTETDTFLYVFDPDSENAFINRQRVPGRPALEKPPKTPGKQGRPRKEALDIVPNKKIKKAGKRK